MELAAIIIAGISLLVSIISIVYAIVAETKARTLAEINTKLANGSLELEIRVATDNANARVNEIDMKMHPLKAKKKHGSISPEEDEELTSLHKNMRAAIQGMLNIYDEACAKYLDGKVDKERFKRNYIFEIRNLLQSEGLKQYFDPVTSTYKAIMKVYNEWEDLEK